MFPKYFGIVPFLRKGEKEKYMLSDIRDGTYIKEWD
jgi:hypothetical protein